LNYKLKYKFKEISIESGKVSKEDSEVGTVGFEINITLYF